MSSFSTNCNQKKTEKSKKDLNLDFGKKRNRSRWKMNKKY